MKKFAKNDLSHLNLPNFPTVISSSPPSFRSAAEKSYCFENMEIFTPLRSVQNDGEKGTPFKMTE
ncbi:MAG: hypothetical protein IPH58_05245 [Sphingobacteriales bacterium]|nr:hypothetical protein [Sphingobacteriales bacterium]